MELVMAGTVTALIPIVIVFILAQTLFHRRHRAWHMVFFAIILFFTGGAVVLAAGASRRKLSQEDANGGTVDKFISSVMIII